MAHLIVCCDGTWNDKKNSDDGVLAQTNVFKLFNALDLNHTNIKQLSRYQEGVGTSGLIDKAKGGLLGMGLSEDIRDCYQWLSLKYTPGDHIYLFGFSRGAFTARSLAGLIGRYGLANLTQDQHIDFDKRIKSIYRDGYRNGKTLAPEWFHPDSKQVKFIGVWDTVGALGIPDDKILLNLFGNSKRYQFHDTKLGSHIDYARHAVAIDEQRGSFAPTLWDIDENDERAKQVWFPGVHSDVGGGYKEDGLSNAALLWMINEAIGCDLEFKQAAIDQIKPNALDVLHDSHTGFMKALVTAPRTIPCLNEADSFSSSAHNRRANSPISQLPYLPTLEVTEDGVSIDVYAKHQWNWTGVFLEKDVEYAFVAQGQWIDGDLSCDASGMSDGDFHLSELAHIAGDLMGKLEQGWKAISGSDSADAFGSKRFEHGDWFELIGAIADGGNPSIDGTHAPLSHFPIGKETLFKPKKSGYLYCFANDAWGFYDNNRGFVTLTIKKKSSKP